MNDDYSINALLKYVKIMLKYIYDKEIYVDKNLFIYECNNLINSNIIPKQLINEYKILINKIYQLNNNELKYQINYKIRNNINYYIVNLTSTYDDIKLNYGIKYLIDNFITNLEDMCKLYDIVLHLVNTILNLSLVNAGRFKNFQIKINEMDKYIINDLKNKPNIIESSMKCLYEILLLYNSFENDFEKNLGITVINNKLKSLNWNLENVADLLTSLYYSKYYNVIEKLKTSKIVIINNDLIIFNFVIHSLIKIINDADLIEQLNNIDKQINNEINSIKNVKK